MHTGSTFSRQEINATLIAHGYEPGTDEWRHAFCRNYIPLEVGEDAYMESDSFNLDRVNLRTESTESDVTMPSQG